MTVKTFARSSKFMGLFAQPKLQQQTGTFLLLKSILVTIKFSKAKKIRSVGYYFNYRSPTISCNLQRTPSLDLAPLFMEISM